VTASKPKRSRPRRRMVSKAGVSWMALVAATTVGIGSVQRVRAAVSADPSKLGVSERGYRLIVQSYARSSLGTGQLPREREKPLASTQRAITKEELARGIAIDMVGLAEDQEAPVVVAWVESGRPDLDFDALEARPGADAFYGMAPATAGPEARTLARVVLKQRTSG
jgi:hypothetical protein